ncbi:MAG: hydrolase 1, exosortase A system-associated [Chakrabartia sp.]
MRSILTFDCEGANLAATLDDAAGATGLLIVSGGNEIRIGAHRGMAMLAAEIAAHDYPVFRFDRRGIGDSEGLNGEFTSSSADVNAALSAFRAACPHLKSIIAFGNCDAASALLLHQPRGVNGLVLANIWVIDRSDDLPPPAAIRARYLERLKDPRAWAQLFTGAINLRKLANGLLRIAQPQKPSSLADGVAQGLTAFGGPVTILLAKGDATAIAFADEWKKPAFDGARRRDDIETITLDSASHSFASDEDHAVLLQTLLKALKSAA